MAWVRARLGRRAFSEARSIAIRFDLQPARPSLMGHGGRSEPSNARGLDLAAAGPRRALLNGLPSSLARVISVWDLRVRACAREDRPAGRTRRGSFLELPDSACMGTRRPRSSPGFAGVLYNP
jgi:hypothetical protein